MMLTQKSLLLWFVSVASLSQAFVVVPKSTLSVSFSSRTVAPAPLFSSSEENASNEENSKNEETEAAKAEAAEESVEEESEEEPEEDPELTALKEKIAQTEGLLKEKRRQLALTQDQADEYTKTGYARKVAAMENMRRARSMLNSSNKYSSTAGILTKFLSLLDQLTVLRETFSEDEFGKQYSALAGDMKGAFSKMGVAEYGVAQGEPVDTARVVVVDSEYSDEIAADCVLKPIRMGLDLQGNIIRMAECVASLGSEADAAAAAEEGEANSEEATSEGEE